MLVALPVGLFVSLDFSSGLSVSLPCDFGAVEPVLSRSFCPSLFDCCFFFFVYRFLLEFYKVLVVAETTTTIMPRFLSSSSAGSKKKQAQQNQQQQQSTNQRGNNSNKNNNKNNNKNSTGINLILLLSVVRMDYGSAGWLVTFFWSRSVLMGWPCLFLLVSSWITHCSVYIKLAQSYMIFYFSCFVAVDCLFNTMVAAIIFIFPLAITFTTLNLELK